MARLPTNLKELKAYNELLGDISVKLDKLSSLGGELLKVDVDSFFQARDHVSDFEAKLRSAAKIAPELSRGLQKYAVIQKKINEMEKNRIKLQERLEALQLSATKRTKEENEELKKTEEKIGEINKELGEMNEQLTSSKMIAGAVGKVIGGSVLNAVESLSAAAVNFGMAVTSWSFDKAIAGLKHIYDFQERSTKAAGTFRLEMGAFTQDIKTATKTASALDGQIRSLTGGDIGEGFKAYSEFSEGLGFVNAETDKFAKSAWEIGRATGVGTEAVGKFYRAISIQTDSFADGRKETAEFTEALRDGANESGMSVAKFSKEIAGSMGFMARFGKAGRKTFTDTAKYAAKLGVSLKSLEAFTDLTDTFEGAAEASAKMNSTFGTSINALDLMLEQDPSKRFEQVRQSMLAQGRTMKDLMPQEVKFLAKTLAISDEEVQAAIREGKTIEEVAKAREKAGSEKENQERSIRNALSMTAQTLFNFRRAWDGLTGVITKALEPLAGFLGLSSQVGDKTKKITTFGGVMTEMFARLAKVIEKVANSSKFQDFLKIVAADLGTLFKRIDEFLGGQGLDKLIDGVTSTLKVFYDLVKKAFGLIYEKKDTIIGFFSSLAENMGVILALFAGAKFAKMMLGVGQFGKSAFDLFKAIGTVAGAGAAAPAAVASAAPAAVAAGATGAGAAGAGAAGAGAGGAGVLGIGLGPLLAIVAAIAAAVYVAYEAVQAFKKDVGGLATSIMEKFDSISERLSIIFTPFLEKVIYPIGRTIGEILDPVLKMFGGDGTLGEFFGTAVLKYIDDMMTSFDQFLTVIQLMIEYAEEFAGFVSDVGGFLYELVEPTIKDIKYLWGELGIYISGMFTSIKTVVVDVFTGIFKFITTQADLIVSFWKQALSKIPFFGDSFKDGPKDDVKKEPGWLDRVVKFGADIGTSIGNDVTAKLDRIEATKNEGLRKRGKSQGVMSMPELDLTGGRVTPAAPISPAKNEMVFPEMDLSSGSVAAPGKAPPGTKQNLADKKKTAAAAGDKVTLVAGDVYLDGGLVGRHLARLARTS